MDLRIKKIKTDNLPPQDEGDCSKPVSPADRLCEDELSLILSNVSISTRDLFNFRLVNKSWRDAATSNLLQRDAICVPLGLDMGMRELLSEHENNDVHPSERKQRTLCCKLGIQTKRTNNIKKLITVMSSSKRFPSYSFHLCIQNGTCTKFRDSRDFMLFLELHGKNIKTLILHGYLPSDFPLDLLLLSTPNLKCLNLSKANFFRADASSLSVALKNLPIQSVFLSAFPSVIMSNEIIHQLLSIPPS